MELQVIKELITTRFDGMDSRVDGLTVEVKLTNGRLRTAEADIANAKPRIQTLEREMGEARARIDTAATYMREGLDNLRDEVREAASAAAAAAAAASAAAAAAKKQEEGENRGIRKWDVIVALGSMGATVGVLKFFGLLP